MPSTGKNPLSQHTALTIASHHEGPESARVLEAVASVDTRDTLVVQPCDAEGQGLAWGTKQEGHVTRALQRVYPRSLQRSQGWQQNW